jgi:AraC-like DNA-binding protein
MWPDANVVLRGRARRHWVRDFPGPLSIKTVERGSGVWTTAEGRFRVDESSFLVLNEGQPYSLEIESRVPVETCCVFFERGFLGPAQEFPTRLSAPDARILPRLRILFRAQPEEDVEDQLVALAADVQEWIRKARGERMRAPGKRRSTREEVHRRVERAREYLHARYRENVSLDEMARVACLSPYHFHRAFTQVLGETPRQYRTRLRLERARQLLARGGMPVTQVCLDSGFESLGSFSSLYRRRFGRSPRQEQQ